MDSGNTDFLMIITQLLRFQFVSNCSRNHHTKFEINKTILNKSKLAVKLTGGGTDPN